MNEPSIAASRPDAPPPSAGPTIALLPRPDSLKENSRPTIRQTIPFFSGWRLRVYLGAALGLPWLLILFPSELPWALPLMIAVHSVAVLAAILPNCQWFGPVATRFRTDRREVWLTIDDGPHAKDTPRLLEVLERFQARATFFVVGSQVEARPDLARAVVARGHELASHSHTHPVSWFWCAPPWVVSRQIDRSNRAIHQATGQWPRWFRSPLGANNGFVHAALRRRNLKPLGWSARGYDGVDGDACRIVARLLRGLRPGVILLLHEGRRNSRGESVHVRVLETLLRRLTEEGYACVIPETARVD